MRSAVGFSLYCLFGQKPFGLRLSDQAQQFRAALQGLAGCPAVETPPIEESQAAFDRFALFRQTGYSVLGPPGLLP